MCAAVRWGLYDSLFWCVGEGLLCEYLDVYDEGIQVAGGYVNMCGDRVSCLHICNVNPSTSKVDLGRVEKYMVMSVSKGNCNLVDCPVSLCDSIYQ